MTFFRWVFEPQRTHEIYACVCKQVHIGIFFIRNSQGNEGNVWSIPPETDFKALQAVSQLISELGIKPKFTLSATSEGQVKRLSPSWIVHLSRTLFILRFSFNASIAWGLISHAKNLKTAGFLLWQNVREVEVDGWLEEQSLFRHQRAGMDAWNALDWQPWRRSRCNISDDLYLL